MNRKTYNKLLGSFLCLGISGNAAPVAAKKKGPSPEFTKFLNRISFIGFYIRLKEDRFKLILSVGDMNRVSDAIDHLEADPGIRASG